MISLRDNISRLPNFEVAILSQNSVPILVGESQIPEMATVAANTGSSVRR